MNLYQILVLAFALFVTGITLWAIAAVVKSPDLRFKPLWIIGSLFGVVGLGINWTAPDDLTFLFGVWIPVVTVFKVATGEIIVKAGIPIIAVVALETVRSARR